MVSFWDEPCKLEPTMTNGEYLAEVALWGDDDLTMADIARRLSVSYEQVRSRVRRERAAHARRTAWMHEDDKVPVFKDGIVRGVGKLELPVPAFAVPVPRVARNELREVFTGVVYNDVHYPEQDEKALSVLYRVVAELDPDVVVNGGDLIDANGLGSFAKNPYRTTTLQDEIDMAREHLHHVASLAPHARLVYLEGNHEDRLRRVKWKMAEQYADLIGTDAVRDQIEWENLFRLKDIGWEFVPYVGQTAAVKRNPSIPAFLTKHGNIVRKWSGYSARGEYEKHGTTGISGHVHRMGLFYHRDDRGPHVWIENGCLCTVTPDWMEAPDWHQGFSVITYTEDGEIFGVEPVVIHEGRAMFRGRLYAA